MGQFENLTGHRLEILDLGNCKNLLTNSDKYTINVI